MKQTLRKGDYRTFNVYYMSDWPGGYSSLPMAVTNGDKNFIEDGIVIGPPALNGQGNEFYQHGKTLTHESGHWNGLLHTFQGGCEGPNDYVDDTHAEQENLFDLCSANRDSCSDQPGLDPIHSYMDYPSDACRAEFPPGQLARLLDHWKTFRLNWK
ncbi:hypothetical protein VHEMI05599 [[Torrubiella] hemipterigena]|uniref:Peptidase M43 pregnancy-associated plasma-A domain-containing protein n=1 Tax=[Torrubiella] hemipterigena TaxID=1531966 RepID=A0A0A1THG5_9HYPO|nr:hypothetical protein VHEMI05599 [[Torrubiella] hemipterigena]